MTRILFNRVTGGVQSYPRSDDGQVLGLDRATYHVLTVVSTPEPAHGSDILAQSTPPVVNITSPNGDVNGTYTYGWELVTIPTKPPVPNWDLFSTTVLNNPALNAAVLTADATVANAARSLSTVLLEAKLSGSYVNFSACWKLVVTAAKIPKEVINSLASLASSCNLPVEFVNTIVSV
jgi:hypothetical protein